MDLWVVAAAAGAGYLAKYLHNSSIGDKDSSEELFLGNSTRGRADSRSLFQQIRDNTCPFRRLSRRRQQMHALAKQKDENLGGDDVGSSSRMAPASGINGGVPENVGTDEYDVHWLARKSFSENMELVDVDSIGVGIVSENVELDEYNVHWLGNKKFMENVDADISKHRRFKNTKPLRSRTHQGFVIRPLDAVESCLAAQLFEDHEQMEEYVYNSVHSPSAPVVRPLLITESSRIISQTTADHDHNDEDNLHEKWKIGCSREMVRRSSNNVPEVPSHPSGFPHRMILFVMGITVGMLSVVMAKREVELLGRQLQQTQNLAQDLCDELDAKDALTVRELSNEASQSQRVDDLSDFRDKPSTRSTDHLDEVYKDDGKKQNDPMEEDMEMKNKIEAELEAELEMLELDLKASSRGRTDYVEHDPELDPAYYAVSPKELRLRLHEVIEARLEARIKELETALQTSESRLHFLESRRGSSYSEAESSSTAQSPLHMFQDIDKGQPLVINLEGNALDAYNEAYAEILSMTDSDKETAQSNHHDGNHSVVGSRTSMSQLHFQMRTSESSEEGDTDDEGDHELDMLLIKQIVEKRRLRANLLQEPE